MLGVIMSQNDYRAHDGISSTDLKRMAQSMVHYKYFHDNPEDKDTPALQFGRAYHKYCLEPYDFDNEFVVAPNIDRRTKLGKEAWNNFILENEGKEVISEDLLNTIDAMRKTLYATPFAKKLIYGEHEKSFFWADEETGVECKCRPDSFGCIGNQPICVDLKTCQCAETDKFMRDAAKLCYDIQAAHYCDGLESNLNKNFIFVFVAQEKQPPYAVNILQADEFFMRSGREVRTSLLETYNKCMEMGEWPAYMGFSDDMKIGSLSIPTWMKKAYGYEESEESYET